MIKNIILARHGQSEGNINRKSYEERPDYAIRLTQLGAAQARQAGEELAKIKGNFDVLLSPYFRTRQTFDYAKESFSNRINSVKESPLLREQEWGNGLPKPYDQGAEDGRTVVGTFFYRFNGAESGADVFNRLILFHEFYMKPLLKREETENDLVVMHGFSLRVYLKVLLGMSIEDFEMIRNPKNAEIVKIEVDENGEFELRSKLNIRPKRVANFHYNKEDLA